MKKRFYARVQEGIPTLNVENFNTNLKKFKNKIYREKISL